MTVLETEMMTIARSNMPKVARSLERIADTLEQMRELMFREIMRKEREETERKQAEANETEETETERW